MIGGNKRDEVGQRPYSSLPRVQLLSVSAGTAHHDPRPTMRDLARVLQGGSGAEAKT